jgi:hypothetical protein
LYFVRREVLGHFCMWQKADEADQLLECPFLEVKRPRKPWVAPPAL